MKKAKRNAAKKKTARPAKRPDVTAGKRPGKRSDVTARKRPRAPRRKRDRPPPPATVSAETMDRLVLLAVSGLTPDALRRHAAEGLEIPADQLDEAIAAARRQITLAADYHRDTELGAAITRLDDCYKTARADRDIKTALACQREKMKLLRLHTRPERPAHDEPADAPAEALLRSHLEPLGLAHENDTTEEIARKTIAEFVRLRTVLYREEEAGG